MHDVAHYSKTGWLVSPPCTNCFHFQVGHELWRDSFRFGHILDIIVTNLEVHHFCLGILFWICNGVFKKMTCTIFLTIVNFDGILLPPLIAILSYTWFHKILGKIRWKENIKEKYKKRWRKIKNRFKLNKLFLYVFWNSFHLFLFII